MADKIKTGTRIFYQQIQSQQYVDVSVEPNTIYLIMPYWNGIINSGGYTQLATEYTEYLVNNVNTGYSYGFIRTDSSTSNLRLYYGWNAVGIYKY